MKQVAAKRQKQSSPKVTSIEALHQLTASPMRIPFRFRDQDVEIESRHLNPFESEILNVQLSAVLPAIIRGKTEADDRVDSFNPDYMKRKAHVEREVRAQAVFWTCPSYQDLAKKENMELTVGANMYNPAFRPAILKFVQNYLTDDVLELIWDAIQNSEISVPDLVNLP